MRVVNPAIQKAGSSEITRGVSDRGILPRSDGSFTCARLGR